MDELIVNWPGGEVQRLTNLRIDASHVVRQP